eukprot:1176897-Prorocentrum_minimum.AAC.3
MTVTARPKLRGHRRRSVSCEIEPSVESLSGSNPQAWECCYVGPIRRMKRGNILTPDQSYAGGYGVEIWGAGTNARVTDNCLEEGRQAGVYIHGGATCHLESNSVRTRDPFGGLPAYDWSVVRIFPCVLRLIGPM